MVLQPVKPVYGVLDFQAQIVLPTSPNPPANPIDGSVYFDTDDGKTYIWFQGDWRPSGLPAKPGTGIIFTVDPTTSMTTISVDPAYLGSGGTVPYYRHVQATPSKRWTLNHNLGYHPNVTVVDSSKREVIGDVSYPNVSIVIVDFTAAFSGEAFLS